MGVMVVTRIVANPVGVRLVGMAVLFNFQPMVVSTA